MDSNDQFALAIAERVAEKLAEGIRDGTLLPPAEYLTAEQAAAYISSTEGALETMRKERRGPAYSRPSHKMVRYKRSDLDAWNAEHRIQPGE